MQTIVLGKSYDQIGNWQWLYELNKNSNVNDCYCLGCSELCDFGTTKNFFLLAFFRQLDHKKEDTAYLYI